MLLLLWLMLKVWFCFDVCGFDWILVDGLVLLVGNYFGGNVVFDMFVFIVVFSCCFGVCCLFF